MPELPQVKKSNIPDLILCVLFLAGDQGPRRLHVPALHRRGGRGHRLRSLRRLLRSRVHAEVVRQDVLNIDYVGSSNP